MWHLMVNGNRKTDSVASWKSLIVELLSRFMNIEGLCSGVWVTYLSRAWWSKQWHGPHST
jgi:hypothetical protein